jgi:hypothetical protein
MSPEQRARTIQQHRAQHAAGPRKPR